MPDRRILQQTQNFNPSLSIGFQPASATVVFVQQTLEKA